MIIVHLLNVETFDSQHISAKKKKHSKGGILIVLAVKTKMLITKPTVNHICAIFRLLICYGILL
jgi:hypothetical protein